MTERSRKPAKTTEVPDKNIEAMNVEDCGIIMPISQTANHGTDHWADVQLLLHRGIKNAGLSPKNVWAGSTTDRITPRILSNLFAVPIAVCDISDLNPNVMLELGMRLTSKKPTVVVAETGSIIPFDIRDFEVIFYPPNLNILQMESFFDDLNASLTSKLKSFKDNSYEPFLKDVAIDFLEPQARAVPFEKLVEARLDGIISKIEDITSANKSQSVSRVRVPSQSHARTSGVSIKFNPEEHNPDSILSQVKSKSGYVGDVVEPGVVVLPFSDRSDRSDVVNQVRECFSNSNFNVIVGWQNQSR